MDGVKTALEAFVLDPRFRELLMVVKAARNGAVYGTKIRFPHALVTAVILRDGSPREKAHMVLRATYQHARNLACFASIYTAVMRILRAVRGGLEHTTDALVAGTIGGYLVFGRRNKAGRVASVTKQIVIYIFARAVLAAAKLATKPGVTLLSSPRAQHLRDSTWPYFAAFSWGAVMWLFRKHPDTLQGSLRGSMTYIYANAEVWDSLRNFIWHNM